MKASFDEKGFPFCKAAARQATARYQSDRVKAI